MRELKVTVRDKIATAGDQKVVCGNSDYTVCFDLDAEWDAYETKTMRVVYHDHTYTDVVFTGIEAPLPVVVNQSAIRVGLFAGDLHTSSPAYFPCVPSILCGSGTPVDPEPDVYGQIMELIKHFGEIPSEKIANAVAEYLTEYPVEVSDVVKYVAQSLTDEQKAQARENIGAGISDFDGDYSSLINKPTIPSVDGMLKYTAQSLTDAQKTQARTNIGAGTSSFSGKYDDLDNLPDLSNDYELVSDTTIPEPVSAIEVSIPRGKTDLLMFARGRYGTEPSNKRVGFKVNGGWRLSYYTIAYAWRYFKMHYKVLPNGMVWIEQQENNMAQGGNVTIGLDCNIGNGIYYPFIQTEEINKVSFSMTSTDGTLDTGFQFIVFAR